MSLSAIDSKINYLHLSKYLLFNIHMLSDTCHKDALALFCNTIFSPGKKLSRWTILTTQIWLPNWSSLEN